jgi:hypothetical protein
MRRLRLGLVIHARPAQSNLLAAQAAANLSQDFKSMHAGEASPSLRFRRPLLRWASSQTVSADRSLSRHLRVTMRRATNVRCVREHPPVQNGCVVGAEYEPSQRTRLRTTAHGPTTSGGGPVGKFLRTPPSSRCRCTAELHTNGADSNLKNAQTYSDERSDRAEPALASRLERQGRASPNSQTFFPPLSPLTLFLRTGEAAAAAVTAGNGRGRWAPYVSIKNWIQCLPFFLSFFPRVFFKTAMDWAGQLPGIRWLPHSLGACFSCYLELCTKQGGYCCGCWLAVCDAKSA